MAIFFLFGAGGSISITASSSSASSADMLSGAPSAECDITLILRNTFSPKHLKAKDVATKVTLKMCEYHHTRQRKPSDIHKQIMLDLSSEIISLSISP